MMKHASKQRPRKDEREMAIEKKRVVMRWKGGLQRSV